MIKQLSYSLKPEIALNQVALYQHIKAENNLKDGFEFQISRKSIDARKRNVVVNLEITVYIDEPIPSMDFNKYVYPDISKSKSVIIVGAGPAGLFAALRLIELGIKPIVFERGKDVKSRRRDIAAINKIELVNPDSNYCFGEGGAGTYSDGKLYTRSKKRGNIRRILEILVNHGATENILIDAHPHIGTNKLPTVVESLRKTIIEAGGEVHFDAKVTDFIKETNLLKGVVVNDNQEYLGESVILATGHSARDIFYLLKKHQIKIENKPFAMGVRVEHSQSFVDTCQYHSPERGLLPAASYSLVAQTYYKNIQRGVFSFCMCPGGFIVPASTEQHELVVNGMSPSRRDSEFANSGIVVAVNDIDWQKFKKFGDLAALEFQKYVEQRAYQKVAEKLKVEQTQKMPAQKIQDFFKGQISRNLNTTSFQPGLLAMDFNEVLPDNLSIPLKDGLKQFGQKMKNYENGQMIGIESRTSSPVRIPRDRESFEHVAISRLYPCGEGAGYAGGIVSAAMDGERVAEAIYHKYF